MLHPIDNYFLQHEEPNKSCIQALRQLIIGYDDRIAEKWLYEMPFYYFDGNRFCYLWFHKKLRQPYIGIVDGNRINHPDLISEKRSRMKILLVDPGRNIPVAKIRALLRQTLALYR